MKKAILILCIAVSFSNWLYAQDNLPSFMEIAKEFFTNYSRDTSEGVFFAKKKEGWYVRLVDSVYTDHIKSQQLFWDVNEKKYKPLKGFGPGISGEEADQKIAERLRGDDAPYYYGFERCRYYGYDDWDIDMVKDFGNTLPANDTLLEGLARAYDAFGQRSISYSTKVTANETDPSKKKLYKTERPSKEQLDQFLLYVNKGIECYRVLAKRNPGYKVIVGTSGMKLVNEQFLLYQQFTTYGYTKEAAQVMNSIGKDDTYSRLGRMYLNSCPPNSILITYGDNDTYSTWYVQEKEGFRKDVAVVNNSLLNTMPYLQMLKKTKKVSFSMPDDFFTKINVEYVAHLEPIGQPGEISLPLRTLITDLYNVKYPYVSNGDSLSTFQTKTIILETDPARLKKICTQNNFARSMIFELNYFMFLGDLVQLDILDKNLYTRPICATGQADLFPKQYMQREGFVYRILPLDENLTNDKLRIETNKLQNFLVKNYKPIIVSYGKNLNEYEDISFGIYKNLFAELINNYLALENIVKAKEWAAKYISNPDVKKLEPDYGDFQIIEPLMKTGYTSEAGVIAKRLAQKFLDSYHHYSAVGMYRPKAELLGILEYLKSIVGEKNAVRDDLQKMINDLR